MERPRNIENDFDKIVNNNPKLDKNILGILIGMTTKKDETEEQLLNNAKNIITTLTNKEWSTWCGLINNRRIKQKIEDQMEQFLLHDPNDNLSYIIQKILKHDDSQETIDCVHYEDK